MNLKPNQNRMKITRTTKSLIKLLFVFIFFGVTNGSAAANEIDQAKIKATVDESIEPLLQKYNIPGLAVAVTINGKSYFYNYGVNSKEMRQPITNKTIFEIGSISKTFTATLAAYAQVEGKLSLSDSVGTHLAQLRGSRFDNISLLNLATHTSGGLPLQVPENIKNNEQLMDYFKSWQPDFAPGTYRTYSNPSIGLLGVITAKSFGKSFEDLIENTLFPKLGMKDSYINVPTDKMKNYAQGYTKTDEPIRVSPGILDAEAYGVKSSSADMIRFIEANMDLINLDEKLKRAITDTHVGYFKTGEMTQDLIWEQYPYPGDLKTILTGNSTKIIFEANPVIKINPPLPPQENVFINKTGSTNGFGCYVAFVPAKKMGIVLLANKNYPIESRVTAAYQILTKLDNQTASKN